MIRKLLVILLFLAPNISYAKLNIAVSISPVASLVAMIAKDKAEISVISGSQSCPHHYSLKPGDLKIAEKANLLIYIDDDFDGFAAQLLPKNHAKSLKISSIKGLYLIPYNWHLWLLPNNAKQLLHEVEQYLSKISPSDEEFFKNNLKLSLSILDSLEQQRQSIIHKGAKFNLLTDSAQYLFARTDAATEKLYQSTEYLSLKSALKLKEALSDKNAVYILSDDQDINKFKNILGREVKIIQLATENWEQTANLQSLYHDRYLEILSKLSN